SPPANKNGAAPPPLTDELVAELLKGRGLRGWLRLARVSRVLGLFTLYLFLEPYDFRASFNLKMSDRGREEMASSDRLARVKARLASFRRAAFDRLVRITRYVVFRGH